MNAVFSVFPTCNRFQSLKLLSRDVEGAHVFQSLLSQSAAVMDTGTLKLERSSLSCLGISPPLSCRSLTWQPAEIQQCHSQCPKALKQPRQSKIPVTKLEQLKSCFLCCCLVLVPDGHRAATGYSFGLPAPWGCPCCEGICFCLPRLIALIFRPASFSTVGSHYRQAPCPGQNLSHPLNCMVQTWRRW